MIDVADNVGDRVMTVVSFPDLLAKVYLAKPPTAFGKAFIRRSGTRFGFLVPRGVYIHLL